MQASLQRAVQEQENSEEARAVAQRANGDLGNMTRHTALAVSDPTKSATIGDFSFLTLAKDSRGKTGLSVIGGQWYRSLSLDS